MRDLRMALAQARRSEEEYQREIAGLPYYGGYLEGRKHLRLTKAA